MIVLSLLNELLTLRSGNGWERAVTHRLGSFSEPLDHRVDVEFCHREHGSSLRRRVWSRLTGGDDPLPNLCPVSDGRLLIVTGKGGVGRSAVSAALAVSAARQGARVLAIDMNEAAGLGSHLGAESLEFESHEVRPGLSALSIDRPAALDEYLRLQMGIPRFARMGPVARAFDALATAAPGIRETITMGKVLYEAARGDWDLVVTDAPPSGQIASFLRSPRTIAELVPTGRVRDQTHWMEEHLRDHSSLVVVTLAEELPVNEVREFLQWLDDHPVMSVERVLVNRTLEPLGFDPLARRGQRQQAALLHGGLVEQQEIWRNELGAHQPLPFFFGATGPIEVAERLADELEAL